jgi:hypothetical protein
MISPRASITPRFISVGECTNAMCAASGLLPSA